MPHGWQQAGPGVFQRRYDPGDVSVGAIVGPSGVVVVDTRDDPGEAAEILADVDAAFGLPVVAVIDTHAHYDHTFGNQAFAARGIPILGHRRIAAHFARFEAPRLRAAQADPSREPAQDWREVVLTPPTVEVDAPTWIDHGGVRIDLLPLSPGHTDTDLAVHVPGAGVWFLGDVVEESGPPMFGSGSHPLGWGGALREVLERIGPQERIVPGHGRIVDRAFVVRQAAELQQLADEIALAHAAGLAADDVVLSESLRTIWPDDFLRSALRDGYAQLEGRDAPAD